MFEWLLTAEGWFALGTLIALEIVLGIDNIIFISILTLLQQVWFSYFT
jgi:predicted tellurium resistance membrane protein TerC